MIMNKTKFEQILTDYYSTAPPIKYVIAVDFDKVLCNSQYPQLGEEIKPICDFVRSIKNLNCYIILWTCRHGKALQDAIQWCWEHELHFDYINENAYDRRIYYSDCRKLSYNMLIDDMALGFNDIQFAPLDKN
jgi:hypothetical protein